SMARAIDSAVQNPKAEVPVAARPIAPRAVRAPHEGAALAPTAPSTVDDLLARFSAASTRDEQRVARSLKMFAGLEITAPPPVVWERPRPTVEVEPKSAPSCVGRWDASPPPPRTSKSARPARGRFALSAALLTIGLIGTGTIWRLRGELWSSAAAATPQSA